MQVLHIYWLVQVAQLGMNYEQSLHILIEETDFNIELLAQELHNELVHVWQLGILVHSEQMVFPPDTINPYWVSGLHVRQIV